MLKAGFSRLDVTPPLGTYLCGYFRKRYATRINDPIEISAIALSDGNETALIIIADFEGIEIRYASKIKKLITERTGVKPEYIMLHTTHAHSSIGLVDSNVNNVMEDYDYLDFLYRKFGDVSVMAIEDMSEAKWCYGEKETAEQLSFVRRYIMKNGLVRTNPFGVEKDIVKPSEEPDNTVRLVRFKREGKKDIAFVNFATHADVVAIEEFSADWPGFARRNIEKDLKDVHCAVMVGFQGDVNHLNFVGGIKRGMPRALEMGRVIADTVLDLWDNTKEGEGDVIYGAVDLVFNKNNTDKEEFYDECRHYLDTVERDEAGNAIVQKTPSGISYTEACRVVKIKEASPIYRKIPISVLSIGGFSIVGIGCEAFTNYARAVRGDFPEKKIFTACLTNGNEGYLPTKVAFDFGGYEVVTSPFTRSVEDQCIESIKTIMK